MTDTTKVVVMPTPIRPVGLPPPFIWQPWQPYPFILPFWTASRSSSLFDHHHLSVATDTATIGHSKPNNKHPQSTFQCSTCRKQYDSQSAFNQHLRTHVNGCECRICAGEKPFKCPVCSKAFADKSNLRAHIQTHSGTKPFECIRCGKSFALKSYLAKHEESACFKLSTSQ